MLRRGAGLALTAFVAISALLSACSVEFTVANAPALIGPFHRLTDVAYGRGPRQRLDIYRPDGAADRPIVVFWYGGGWTEGSKRDYRFVGAALARLGYVTVLPDYRLYPQARFPEFLEDAARAFLWVHAHAREFGGDPARIFVMGHSAGAHQAAMLAYDERVLARVGADRSWIRGFIGLSGPYVLVPNSPVLEAIFAPPYTPHEWQPVRFVDAGAPPTLIVHGIEDATVSVAQARALDTALRAAGVPSELELYPRLGHADTVAALSVVLRHRAPVLERVHEFIERTGPSR